MKKKTTGMVLGKFMPLHKGHELLLRFASHYVDKLYVVVDWNDVIDGERRCKWVRETVPNAEVFYLNAPHPQAPEEHPDFWNVWRNSLLSIMPQKPDYVFASESYGTKLAEVLDATFIPLDLKRQNIPISATKIRGSLWEQWDYLSIAAKRDYLVRVCIFGPESSGKSTLTHQLAAHYNTVFTPEYARFYIETKGSDLEKKDMLHIGQGQVALEDSIAPTASRYLFCDTDPLATTIWSRWFFDESDEALLELAQNKTYPLYLVTEPDLPWKDDMVRYFPKQGAEFFDDCCATLKHYNRNFFTVGGSGEKRLQHALDILESHQDKLFQL